MNEAQYKESANNSKREGFRQWMQEPMTRALISMIPPCEQLETILQAAFEQGFNSGSGNMAVTFLQTILTKESK